jgi:acyl carrier protein
MNETIKTRDEILIKLKEIMEEYFEVSSDLVVHDANLYDDLDIDSIDAVDLMVKLKEITGKKIDAEIFKNVRTVEDVIDAVFQIVN